MPTAVWLHAREISLHFSILIRLHFMNFVNVDSEHENIGQVTAKLLTALHLPFHSNDGAIQKHF
jgi:hypothetical protein